MGNCIITKCNIDNYCFYATCDTAADVVTKVVTLADSTGWKLRRGVIVGIKFAYSNSAEAPTLDVNNTGDKSIYYNNAVYTGTSSAICGYANRVSYYMYDGTYWVFVSNGIIDSNTDTKVRQTLKTDNVNRPLLMAYSNTSTTTGNVDNVSYRNNSIYANASTGNIQAVQLNGVTIGSSPKFTDTKYTPSTTIVNSITAVGSLPTLTFTPDATTGNLTIAWSQGSLPTKGSNTTVVTGITES